MKIILPIILIVIIWAIIGFFIGQKVELPKYEIVERIESISTIRKSCYLRETNNNEECFCDFVEIKTHDCDKSQPLTFEEIIKLDDDKYCLFIESYAEMKIISEEITKVNLGEISKIEHREVYYVKRNFEFIDYICYIKEKVKIEKEEEKIFYGEMIRRPGAGR